MKLASEFRVYIMNSIPNVASKSDRKVDGSKKRQATHCPNTSAHYVPGSIDVK